MQISGGRVGVDEKRGAGGGKSNTGKARPASAWVHGRNERDGECAAAEARRRRRSECEAAGGGVVW